MHNRKILLIAMLAALLVMVPLTSDTSDATTTQTVNGVNVTVFDDALTLKAGGTTYSTITFTNTNDTKVAVHISCTDNANTAFSASVDDSEFDIGDKSKQVKITVTADRLSRHGDYVVTVNIVTVNYESGTVTESVAIPISVTVTSTYSSDGVYNRILGIFDPLGAPLDSPAATAVITFLIWIGISVVSFFILRSVVYAIFRNDRDAAKEISHKTGAMLILSIMIYGLSNALMTYGADEILIATLQNVSSFLYIPIMAFIVWNIYTNAIKAIFHQMEAQDRIAGADSSLIPLFNMLGKIVIAVVAASALLSTMGFDLVAIITGAGIAGMAISLGAQNTLSEFFSGINLMSTRPFRRGDMVTIDGQGIYQVEKVGLLNSRFKNWISMEYVIMPNSKVVSSTIMNITGKTMAYRLFLYYTVSYDSDVELTKQILLEAAYNHPQVIVDGSYSKPDVRLDAFEDSAIKFRLAVYITDFRDNIAVTDELNEEVFRNLCKAGIEIPYNKLDVYIKDDNEEQH